MSSARFRQRLAAILAADVAGYSRLMAADEAATVEALDAARAVFRCQIEALQGRVIDMAGDSVLAIFDLASGAAAAARAIQEELDAAPREGPEERRMRFRIGIHLGEIIEKPDGTVYGDGVNVAARIQALAEPGGMALSDEAHRLVRDRLPLDWRDGGEHTVKNIVRPVRIWCWSPGLAPAAAPTAMPVPGAGPHPLPLPDKPSIAVLAFQNMSGDPEQEYFADGMVEEIITALSRLRWLFVIARNSSFTYRKRAMDVRQIGRELGVRYILEGSVRKAANRVRIAGQLLDVSTGAHLWAERFDGTLEEVFDLQDQVATKVVGAIAPKLEQAEIERAKRKPTESLDAHDHYLRGLASVYRWTKRDSDEALRHFSQAIALDPDYASAYGMAARCYSARKVSGWVDDIGHETAEAARLAKKVAQIGRDDAVALYTGGMALAYCVGELDDGAAMIERALTLNPNAAWAWLFSGWTKVWQGDPERALECIARAAALSPQDPQFFNMRTGTAWAHLLAGRYDEAQKSAQLALAEQPDYVNALYVLAASNALAGQLAPAREAMTRLQKFDPGARIALLMQRYPFRRPEDLANVSEGLRRAGMPE